jgi:two-component system invasion response regulator UvrY
MNTRLSDRELEVLKRLARGERATSIGIALDLSIKTVSTYRRRVLDKLELQTNADLKAYASAKGLLDENREASDAAH